jgi:hypothetical protein
MARIGSLRGNEISRRAVGFRCRAPVARRSFQCARTRLVPTKMCGPEAPDDLEECHRTQVWLAVSDDPAALVSGEYFYHQKRISRGPGTRVVATRERLLFECQQISGIRLRS